MPVQIPSLGLSFFTIPKNGGTTLWHWSHWLRTGREVEGNVYHQGWMCDGEVERETVIVRRDPVERFVSGYRNFRDKRGLSMGFDRFVTEIPRLIRSDGDIRHHFAPQSDYFPWMPLAKVDHVFEFEEFGKLRDFLENRAGRKLPAFHAQKSCFSDFEVRDEHIELIQQYYLKDYLAGFGRIVDDE